MTSFLWQAEDKDEGTNYAATTGTIGRVPIPGADDMMTEMAKRLRERRAKAEGLNTVSHLAKKKCWIIYT